MKTINLLETEEDSSGISLNYKKGTAKPCGDQGLRMATHTHTHTHTQGRLSVLLYPPVKLGTRRDLLRRI